MKNLTDEIKLTIEMMQGDIDDGAHGELQWHLCNLLEMKREQFGEVSYRTDTTIITNWPASADERIDVIGQNGNDGEHYEEWECTKCGRRGSVGRCCGIDTRTPAK